ncbi:MAG: SurA N-terminal domain-containing protein [Candidatus Spechtbacterales bacterium]|nr:SurA N-terminal domain-containing protein [Candidatus Spechtbacterales bacterium]
MENKNEQNKKIKEQNNNKDTLKEVSSSEEPGNDALANVIGPVTEIEDTTNTANKKNLLIKQIGLSVLALLFVGGALFSIMRPQKVLSLLEPFGIETSEPVAVVNGDKIYRDALNARVLQQKSTYEAQGADLSDPETLGQVESQILNVMVSEELVLNSAKKEGITADSSKIDEEFNKTKESFPSEEEFNEQLSSFGLTESMLRENISNQIIIEKYLKNKVSENAVAVSEEEVQDFYNQYSGAQEDVESLDVLYSDIEQYLKQEKTNQEIARIVEDLRESAEIEILL